MKAVIIATVGMTLAAAPGFGQQSLSSEPPFIPTAGVGVGVGVGVGLGLAGSIAVERVPGNIVQGRRVFAAFYAALDTGRLPFAWQTIDGGSTGSDNTPNNNTHFGTSKRLRNVTSGGITTTLTVFNPGTNAVTFSKRTVRSGAGAAAAVTVALGPGQSVQLEPEVGPPGGTPDTGMLVIESIAPLEVVAFYQSFARELVDEVVRELHEECVCSPDPHPVPPVYE